MKILLDISILAIFRNNVKEKIFFINMASSCAFLLWPFLWLFMEACNVLLGNTRTKVKCVLYCACHCQQYLWHYPFCTFFSLITFILYPKEYAKYSTKSNNMLQASINLIPHIRYIYPIKPYRPHLCLLYIERECVWV